MAGRQPRPAALRLDPAVAAPTNQDLQRLDPLAREEVSPIDEGKNSFFALPGPPVFRGVVPSPAPSATSPDPARSYAGGRGVTYALAYAY